MYERCIAPILAQGKKSLLLLGPRQVGKSTLLKCLSPDLSLNFADPRTYREYVVRPEKLFDELNAAGDDIKSISLDEVQKVPALLDWTRPLRMKREFCLNTWWPMKSIVG